MDTDEAPPGNRTVNIQTSESEQGDLGDEIGDDSSVLDSSSDPPARHEVPSVGPDGGYTAVEALPPSTHTSTSVSSTHTLVSVRSHLLECAPSQISQQCLFCGALPTPHPGSQDARCVTRCCFCPPKLPSLTPKWLSLIGCLDERAQNQLMLLSWVWSGSRWLGTSATSRNR